MTTTITTRRALGLAALALSAPLVLAACGGSSDAAGEQGSEGTESSESVQEAAYEFTQPAYASEGGALEVRIPEALKEAAGADLEGLLVTGMTLTAHELESASSCAVDVEVAYAEGGEVALQTAGQTEEQFVAAAEESFEQDLQYGLNHLGYLSWEDMVAEVGEQEAVETMSAAFVPITAEGTLDVEAVRASYDGGNPRDNTLAALGLSGGSVDVYDLGELEASVPEAGVYASDNASEITIVQDCAASVADEEATEFTLEIPRSDEEESSGVSDAASFLFTVMTSGQIGILDGEVDGYQVDANGDWIAS